MRYQIIKKKNVFYSNTSNTFLSKKKVAENEKEEKEKEKVAPAPRLFTEAVRRLGRYSSHAEHSKYIPVEVCFVY